MECQEESFETVRGVYDFRHNFKTIVTSSGVFRGLLNGSASFEYSVQALEIGNFHNAFQQTFGSN